MRIPKKIEVKGKIWKVAYKWGLKDDNDNPVDGLCVYATKTILIDRKCTVKERPATFLHELLHALFHELHLGQADFSSDLEEIIDENVVQFIMDKFTLRLKQK